MILTVALIVLVLAILALRRQPPAVQVVNVTREDLNETITSNGKVEPISPLIARAEFPTFVSTIQATEGQTVRRGQQILALDAADVQSQLSQSRANLIAAENDLQNAKAGGSPDELAQIGGDLEQAQLEVANLERTEKALEQLVPRQAATQEELAQNQASLAKSRSRLQFLMQKKQALEQRASVNAESAGLRIKQAQVEVQSLLEKARSASVVAPQDGVLYSLPVRVGDYVKVGDVLAEMADLRHVRVRAFVDEPDLGWLEQNQNVQVAWDAKPGRTWTGRTVQLPKQVVPHGVRSVGEVLCSVDNDRLELFPNVNVEVRIMVRERHGVLVVPRAAVREEDGHRYVFALKDGRLRRQEITVGVTSASKYEVLSGLTLDERVALPGEEDLRDGAEVRVTEGD